MFLCLQIALVKKKLMWVGVGHRGCWLNMIDLQCQMWTISCSECENWYLNEFEKYIRFVSRLANVTTKANI